MKITDLKKIYGKFSLNIQELEFDENKIHGIIGSNGSGKSTLVKIISGLIEPDNGKVDYGDIKMQDITITSQRPYMLHDSVYKNLIYPLKIRKKKISKEEIAEWLTMCGLLGKEKQYAPSLSGGERQKLSFARALIFGPKVVVIDETMANLDPDSVALFEKIISERQKTDPITWIIVSHQPAQIYKLCDMVYFMDKGIILDSGRPEELYFDSQNSVISQYMSNFMIMN